MSATKTSRFCVAASLCGVLLLAASASQAAQIMVNGMPAPPDLRIQIDVGEELTLAIGLQMENEERLELFDGSFGLFGLTNVDIPRIPDPGGGFLPALELSSNEAEVSMGPGGPPIFVLPDGTPIFDWGLIAGNILDPDAGVPPIARLSLIDDCVSPRPGPGTPKPCDGLRPLATFDILATAPGMLSIALANDAVASSPVGDDDIPISGIDSPGILGEGFQGLTVVTVEITPEPGTALLLGTGLFALGVRRRRP